MRILILHNSGSSTLPSGEDVVAEQDARALRAEGVAVRQETVFNDELEDLGGLGRAVAGLNLFWSRPSYRRTSALVRDFRPDVAHFHGVLPLLTVASFAACKDLSVPVVQTLHNSRWYCVEGGLFRNETYCDLCLQRGPLQGIRHRCSRGSLAVSTLLTLNNALWVRRGKLFELVDRFLAVSEFLRSTHLKAGFPPDRVVVKRNGIDLDNLPARITPAEERAGVVFVGRLSVSKGTPTLARMLPLMRGTPVKIVGDGPEREVLARVVAQQRLDHVELLGRVAPEQVLSIVGQAACVVAPSLCPEAAPLVSIEALGLGTPLVASRVGGFTEILEGSGGGVTIAPGDAEGFAAAAREICASPERIRELGRNGRAHIERNFSARSATTRLLEIYQEVLAAA